MQASRTSKKARDESPTIEQSMTVEHEKYNKQKKNCSKQAVFDRTIRCACSDPRAVCVMLYLWGSTLNLVKVARFYYLYMRHTRERWGPIGTTLHHTRRRSGADSHLPLVHKLV